MSAELCRRPRALRTFLKHRESKSQINAQISIWEGRQSPELLNGEPLASGRSGDLVEGHVITLPVKGPSRNILPQERLAYSVGVEKPTIGEVLWHAGVTPEGVDSHVLLDYAKFYQEERISKALELERSGELTPRWRGYLRDVRAWIAVEHKLAFEAEN